MRLLRPDLVAQTVLELTPARLRSLGLDAALIDIDCTLKRYTACEPPAEIRAWLEGLRAEGFGLTLVSNGRSHRIAPIGARLGLPVCAEACKPLPFAVGRAARALGAPRRRVAMIGDQVYADVMAGRLAGLYTILVRPMHPEEEPWFTRLKRPFERLVVRW